jgi:hypothetical protein
MTDLLEKNSKKIKVERLDVTDFFEQKYFDSMTPNHKHTYIF